MHPIKYFNAPYNVEQVANQRQKLLKVRLAGVWGAAACAAGGGVLDLCGAINFVQDRVLSDKSPLNSAIELVTGTLMVGVFGGLSHHGFDSWNHDTILEQQLIAGPSAATPLVTHERGII